LSLFDGEADVVNGCDFAIVVTKPFNGYYIFIRLYTPSLSNFLYDFVTVNFVFGNYF